MTTHHLHSGVEFIDSDRFLAILLGTSIRSASSHRDFESLAVCSSDLLVTTAYLADWCLTQTNNHTEANRRLHPQLWMEPPTTGRFITGLQKLQSHRDAFFEKIIGGHPPPSKLKKSMKADKRFLQIFCSVSQRSPNEYLKEIAYNFQYIFNFKIKSLSLINCFYSVLKR